MSALEIPEGMLAKFALPSLTYFMECHYLFSLTPTTPVVDFHAVPEKTLQTKTHINISAALVRVNVFFPRSLTLTLIRLSFPLVRRCIPAKANSEERRKEHFLFIISPPRV